MRISELVKTYKLLNDPNAPDWNVKFVGGAIVALAIIAGAAFALYHGAGGAESPAAPAAAVSGGEEPPACSAEEIAAAVAAAPQDAPFAPGDKLSSDCVVH